MARRKRGNPVNGWLIFDKPVGMTSTQAVGFVRRMYDAQKAGHAGTLDPLATGILPIALGEATKTVPFAVDGEKAYRFAVRWGTETTTDDSEGPATKSSDRRPMLDEIEAALPAFIGEVLQQPPSFSAIKVNGERAYDLARDGEIVELDKRIVVIEALRVTDMPDADTTIFEAECGKGTYVRAIARDLGRLLGCYGHVVQLRRTRVGGFHEGVAVTKERLEAAVAEGNPMGLMLPTEAALDDITALPVSSDDAQRIRNGGSILIRGRDAPILAGHAYAMCKGRLVALGELDKGEFHPTRVFGMG